MRKKTKIFTTSAWIILTFPKICPDDQVDSISISIMFIYMLSSFYDEWMYHLYHCILFCVFFQSDIVPPQEQWLSAIDMRVHANGSLITETDIGQTAFDAQCPGHKMTLSMGTFNAIPILYAKTTKPSLWNPDFVVGSLSVNDSHMDVSENRGYPQIIHFNRVFHYKPSILGYLFLETPI